MTVWYFDTPGSSPELVCRDVEGTHEAFKACVERFHLPWYGVAYDQFALDGAQAIELPGDSTLVVIKH